MKKYIIVDENGNNIFGTTYSKAGAEGMWDDFNGIYEREDGTTTYISIMEIDE